MISTIMRDFIDSVTYVGVLMLAGASQGTNRILAPAGADVGFEW
eukprot:gene34707-21539_t